jgi:hypothetical protein
MQPGNIRATLLIEGGKSCDELDVGKLPVFPAAAK